tara:strand:- start:139 stop:858 length:720 start_codon:yes stop_codon:yes gene_type:complete
MIKPIIAIVIMTLAIPTSASNTDSWLISLNSFSDSRDEGKKLMNLSYGLNSLETKNEKERTLLVGVHGGNSQGYEWVYPLKTMDKENILSYFFRWDDSRCAEPSAIILAKQLQELVKETPSIKKIIIIGHSYGGLLASWFAENWTSSLPIDIHAIASPLAGIKILNDVCDYKPPKLIEKNISFFQWRTQQKLDGAFKDLEFNPQVINLKGSQVYVLPNLYKGNRLGHNWSISFVADQLK